MYLANLGQPLKKVKKEYNKPAKKGEKTDHIKCPIKIRKSRKRVVDESNKKQGQQIENCNQCGKE